MNHFDAAQLARHLLAEHRLTGWTFAFNRRKRDMGLCVYDRRRIELSIHFVQANGQAAVRDTILHEIAHAMVGPREGHGPRWRQKARQLGATPRRCGEAVMPQGRWRASCPACGREHHRHRRPMPGRTYFCRACGVGRGKLVFRAGARPASSV